MTEKRRGETPLLGWKYFDRDADPLLGRPSNATRSNPRLGLNIYIKESESHIATIFFTARVPSSCYFDITRAAKFPRKGGVRCAGHFNGFWIAGIRRNAPHALSTALIVFLYNNFLYSPSQPLAYHAFLSSHPRAAGFDSMKTEYNMLLWRADRKIACVLLFSEQKVYKQVARNTHHTCRGLIRLWIYVQL